MRGLLVRLAGGYVGLGALAFALHRARYIGTSRVRDWTDNRSREMEAQLTAMRQELDAVRTELRTMRADAAAPDVPSTLAVSVEANVPGEVSGEGGDAGHQAPASLPQKKRNRRPKKGAPVEQRLAA